MESPGLLSLPDELLLKVLLGAGAAAVARAATLCHRLQAAQAQLAALPAFASAACICDQDLADNVTSAVTAARDQMPAAVDFCLVFVAGSLHGRVRERDALKHVVSGCQALLPPGTLVVGCCGRGLYGVEGGQPVEMDPASKQTRAASVLLGRMPGASVRAFAAHKPPADSWASPEGCRRWLGLEGQQVDPATCLLFTHAASGADLHDCLEGLQRAFPHMLLTGGIASGPGELFCSEPVLPLLSDEQQLAGAETSPTAAAGGSSSTGNQNKGVAALKPRYTGLLICQPASSSDGSDPSAAAAASTSGRGSSKFAAAGLSAQGLRGGQPLLTRLTILRGFGLLQQPTAHGPPEEVELLGLTSASDAQGRDATRALGRLAASQEELGVWVASRADPGTVDGAVAAGRPTAVLQLYGMVQGGEALATASDEDALSAVLAAAEEEGQVVCAQPMKLSSEGAKEALQRGVSQLASACPAGHPLLPTHTQGVVLVSCTAKGKQMHGAAGVEAEIVHASSQGLPMAGVYCDGEIGPEILNCKAAMRWAGRTAPATDAASSGVPPAGATQKQAVLRGKLQGFTTIVTALMSDAH